MWWIPHVDTQHSQTPHTNADIRIQVGLTDRSFLELQLEWRLLTFLTGQQFLHLKPLSRVWTSSFFSPHFPPSIVFLVQKKKWGFLNQGITTFSFFLMLQKAVKSGNSFWSLSCWITDPKWLLRVIKVKLHPLFFSFQLEDELYEGNGLVLSTAVFPGCRTELGKEVVSKYLLKKWKKSGTIECLLCARDCSRFLRDHHEAETKALILMKLTC